MLISVVHSFYRSETTSGENLAVCEQVEALQEVGADVRFVAVHSDKSIVGAEGYMRSAARVATGFNFGQEPPKARSSSEILMIHNLFPNFGSKWIRGWPGPIITMVHNYRYLCANGLLLRRGQPCTECIDFGSQRSLVHACYRGSRIATLPLTLATRGRGVHCPPLFHADAVVVQSERALETYAAAGLSKESLVLVPGFVDSLSFMDRATHHQRRGWLFAGRVSPEKGLRELLSIWPSTEELTVAGEGSELSTLRSSAPPSVRMLGQVEHHDLVASLPEFEGLIFPGLCWEGAHPRIVREALAAGTPVIARVGSSAADLILRAGGGQVFDGSSASLLTALSRVRDGGEALCDEALRTAQAEFSKTGWQARMIETIALAQLKSADS